MQNLFPSHSFSKPVKQLLFGWLLVGTFATLAAVLNSYTPTLSILLGLPIILIGQISLSAMRSFLSATLNEKLLYLCLGLVWSSHLMGVFVPETGFDAVWYHLPVIEGVIANQGLVFLPQIYQSVNPLFADLIFGLGYMVSGDRGAKVVAYLFGLSLIFVAYALARLKLSRTWSLVATLLISTFQVVAWQSSSFYVDLAKTVWELGWLLYICTWEGRSSKQRLIHASLLIGASLATKLFSILLLPAHALLVFLRSRKIVDVLIGLVVALIIPLQFYVFARAHTGSAFYAIDLHRSTLDKISLYSGQTALLVGQTATLYQLLPEVVFAKDYTSFALVLLLPVLCWALANYAHKDMVVWSWVVFMVAQLAVWWYLPPLSTRYGLAGFIVWAILTIWAVQKLVQKNGAFKLPLLLTVVIAIGFNLLPRAVVNARQLGYLFGQQTKQQYLEQFLDGNIDQHLRRWHKFN